MTPSSLGVRNQFIKSQSGAQLLTLRGSDPLLASNYKDHRSYQQWYLTPIRPPYFNWSRFNSYAGMHSSR